MLSKFQNFSLGRDRLGVLEEVLELCVSDRPELETAKFLLRRLQQSESETVRGRLLEALISLDNTIFTRKI